MKKITILIVILLFSIIGCDEFVGTAGYNKKEAELQTQKQELETKLKNLENKKIIKIINQINTNHYSGVISSDIKIIFEDGQELEIQSASRHSAGSYILLK